MVRVKAELERWGGDTLANLDGITSPNHMSHWIAANIPITDDERIDLLETKSCIYRLQCELQLLRKVISLSEPHYTPLSSISSLSSIYPPSPSLHLLPLLYIPSLSFPLYPPSPSLYLLPLLPSISTCSLCVPLPPSSLCSYHCSSLYPSPPLSVSCFLPSLTII